MTVSAAAAVLLALCLTACGGKFEVTESTGSKISMELDAAKAGEFVGMNLTVAEGETAVVETNLTKGSVRISLTGMSNADNINEIPAEDKTPAFEEVYEGIGTYSADIPAGDYICTITIEKKATGTLDIYSAAE